MAKEKITQKVKFSGQPNQIYNIGRVSFPCNIWKEINPEQLQHIVEDHGIRAKFDFNPSINFSLIKVEKTKTKAGKKSKKRKED